MNRRSLASFLVIVLTRSTTTTAYVPDLPLQAFRRPSSNVRSSRTFLSALSNVDVSAKYSFIQSELRNAAMRLHTKEQAPKEGTVEVVQPTTPHVPTLADYLRFLVDSQHVYQAMEEIVKDYAELAVFQNTGLERVDALEQDISFLVQEYGLERPAVGAPGRDYAATVRRVAETSRPAFLCHYYNFYFAHTAGGRMIGKQMSALLLNKKTLEFYKWDRDLNEIKDAVKETIEHMAAGWTDAEKNACVQETAAAFQGGGAINSYLSGGGR